MISSTLAAPDTPALASTIRNAFLYAFPIHDLARTRLLFTQRPDRSRAIAPNTLHHNRKLLDHRARQVTMPNNDTLYSSAWLDLSSGPLLLSVPETADRYYSVALMDIFTNNFACPGRRTTGTQAMAFLIAGPQWAGAAPAGTCLVRSPCNDVWLLARILADGEADLPEVHRLQDAMRLEPLGEAALPRPYRTQPQERSPAEFLALVNETLGRNPVPEHERAMLDGFAEVGMRPGMPDAWGALSESVREAWTEWMPKLYRELKSLSAVAPPTRDDKPCHWVGGRDNIGNFGNDYLYRAQISLSGLGALERAEATYLTSRADVHGRRLDGRRRYRLRIPPGMPVDAFWSLSMYAVEADGRAFFVDNPIRRHAIGDRTPGLAFHADGSADLWLQHDRPQGERQANWLPAPPGEFTLALRFYQPRQALLDRHFIMPDPEPLEA